MYLKLPLSHYPMLQTHNRAWETFCCLFLNIVKWGKGGETQNCTNNQFSNISVTSSLKKSEKLSIILYICTLYLNSKECNCPLHCNLATLSHYLSNLKIKDYFWNYKKNNILCLDLINVAFSNKILQAFLIVRNMEMVKPFFHKKFLKHLWLYVYKKRLTISFFNISTFSMFLCLFLLHITETFPKTHEFCNRKIVNHCSTVVKYFETTIKLKFSMVNHYLTKYNTKNWLR